MLYIKARPHPKSKQQSRGKSIADTPGDTSSGLHLRVKREGEEQSTLRLVWRHGLSSSTWEVKTEGSNFRGSRGWGCIVRTACGNGKKAGSGKYLPQKHKGLNLDP